MKNLETVTDIDGNVYHTVNIGTQVWMLENLKTTKFRNGELIGTTIPAELKISGESTTVYQWPFAGDEKNVATYGRLYNWYAITDRRSICPKGWHVPSDEEWSTLINFLGGEFKAGAKLKETGISHWIYDNNDKNSSGFTALPGGYRHSIGTFFSIGYYGYWWSSAEIDAKNASYRYMSYFYGNVYKQKDCKQCGFSVRCIKDL